MVFLSCEILHFRLDYTGYLAHLKENGVVFSLFEKPQGDFYQCAIYVIFRYLMSNFYIYHSHKKKDYDYDTNKVKDWYVADM